MHCATRKECAIHLVLLSLVRRIVVENIMLTRHKNTLLMLVVLLLWMYVSTVVSAAEISSCKSHRGTAAECSHVARHQLDRSGKPRRGEASYYGREFYGKKMANGKRMNPRSNVAASKTLPLGTKAKVTNLETGKSAVVDIQDRGPYVKGRIVDLSPKVAEELDMKHEGVATVQVAPLALPPAEKNAGEK